MEELSNVSQVPDDVATGVADELSRKPSLTGESSMNEPGSGMLAIQIKAGGGTTIMRDIAETERTEALNYLESFRPRYADLHEALSAMETQSNELFEKWKAIEIVGS